jgi:hypothetical protein
MLLGCTTGMALCGNGVRAISWMTILLLQEMAVLIKTKIANTASSGVDRGMSRQHFAAVRRACESCSRKPMSLWDSG